MPSPKKATYQRDPIQTRNYIKGLSQLTAPTGDPQMMTSQEGMEASGLQRPQTPASGHNGAKHANAEGAASSPTLHEAAASQVSFMDKAQRQALLTALLAAAEETRDPGEDDLASGATDSDGQDCDYEPPEEDDHYQMEEESCHEGSQHHSTSSMAFFPRQPSSSGTGMPEKAGENGRQPTSGPKMATPSATTWQPARQEQPDANICMPQQSQDYHQQWQQRPSPEPEAAAAWQQPAMNYNAGPPVVIQTTPASRTTMTRTALRRAEEAQPQLRRGQPPPPEHIAGPPVAIQTTPATNRLETALQALAEAVEAIRSATQQPQNHDWAQPAMPAVPGAPEKGAREQAAIFKTREKATPPTQHQQWQNHRSVQTEVNKSDRNDREGNKNDRSYKRNHSPDPDAFFDTLGSCLSLEEPPASSASSVSSHPLINFPSPPCSNRFQSEGGGAGSKPQARPNHGAQGHTSYPCESQTGMNCEHAQFRPPGPAHFSAHAQKPCCQNQLAILPGDSKAGLALPNCIGEKRRENNNEKYQSTSNNHINLTIDFPKLKLGGANYIAWTQQLQILAYANECEDMLMSPPPKPWNKEEKLAHRRAYALLLRAIDPALYPSVTNGLDAPQIWNKLHTLFYSENKSTTNNLAKDFFSAKLLPGMDMGQHIANLQSLRTQLIQRGEPVSTITLVTTICNSLDETWRPFIHTLESTGRINDVDYLTGRLLEEFNHKQQTKQQRRQHSYYRPHHPEDRRRPPRKQDLDSVNSLVVCHFCGSQGHVKRDCPQVQDDYQAPSQPKPRGNKRGRGRGKRLPRSHQFHGVYQCDYPPTDNKGYYMMDSGASAHIVTSSGDFSELAPLESTVRVANGNTAKVTGVGTVFVPGFGKLKEVLHVPSIPNNIISIMKLCEDPTQIVVFNKNGGFISKNGNIVGKITKVGDLPYLIPRGQANTPNQWRNKPQGDPKPQRQPRVPKNKPQQSGKAEDQKEGKPTAARTYATVVKSNIDPNVTVINNNNNNVKNAVNDNVDNVVTRPRGEQSTNGTTQVVQAQKGSVEATNKTTNPATPTCVKGKQGPSKPNKCTNTKGGSNTDNEGASTSTQGQGHRREGVTIGKPLHSKCAHILHRILGHINFSTVKKMGEFADGVELMKCRVHLDCAVCKETKSKAAPIPKKSKRTTSRPYELIHTDLVGPFKSSLGGKHYLLTVVDDFSRFGHVFTLKRKTEVLENLQYLYNLVETQHDLKIAKIQSDRGSEYVCNKFQTWVKEKGILHFLTNPYSPEENGVAERRNGILQTIKNSLLADAGLSHGYWAEAIVYANYVLNRTWSSVIDQTPYYMIYGKKPSIAHLRIFGSRAWVNIPKPTRQKGGNVAQELTFIGHSQGTKGYRFYERRTGRLVISRDASFIQDDSWSRIHSNDLAIYVNGGRPAAPAAQAADDSSPAETTPEAPAPAPTAPVPAPVPSTSTETPGPTQSVPRPDGASPNQAEGGQQPRRSQRSTKGVPPRRMDEACIASINSVTTCPKTFQDVLQLPDAQQKKWREAMDKEMSSLKKLEVFEPRELPTHKKSLGTRWVYKLKTLPNNELLYKARLVAQGFAQRYLEDYCETYSPTVKAESVKAALVVAAARGEVVHQFDVQTAYLHAPMDEEIYVRGAPGYKKSEGNIWLLRKSLYGLKQSGKLWHDCLTEVLIKLGFKPSNADECVYLRRSQGGLEKLLVYVDDLLYIGPNQKTCDDFATSLGQKFSLKTLGKVENYLGVHIIRSKKGFALSQREKIEQLLGKCNMAQAHPIGTPMETGFWGLTHQDSPPFTDNTLYRSVIGSLQYICNWSRPDIALAVNLLARHVEDPRDYHWTAVKRVLRYLRGTLSTVLQLYPSNTGSACLSASSDADWATDPKTRRSTSGYLILLNDCPIHWHVGQQKFTSCSSAEAEYACLSDTVNDLTWFNSLITDLWERPPLPIRVQEDNTAAIGISMAQSVSHRSRHIDIRYRNVRQLIQEDFIRLDYCSTEEQTADILTKPLPADRHQFLSNKLCLAS